MRKVRRPPLATAPDEPGTARCLTMFDIGTPEILLAAVIALLVLGPERLPEVLRTLGRWIGVVQRSYANLRAQINHELNVGEAGRGDLGDSHIFARTRQETAQIGKELQAVRDQVQGMLADDPASGAAGAAGADGTGSGDPDKPSDPGAPSATGNPGATNPDP